MRNAGMRNSARVFTPVFLISIFAGCKPASCTILGSDNHTGKARNSAQKQAQP
ncbi:MAG TPA: hypothetical protein VM553_12510 [Dongiaceae bacterium]|nr:hypothetical protein [Dongiaceae bacterium]